jgi:putative intracellular protease/amidase
MSGRRRSSRRADEQTSRRADNELLTPSGGYSIGTAILVPGARQGTVVRHPRRHIKHVGKDANQSSGPVARPAHVLRPMARGPRTSLPAQPS